MWYLYENENEHKLLVTTTAEKTENSCLERFPFYGKKYATGTVRL